MSEFLQTITNWAGAIVAGVGGLALLVRRLSRDGTELVKDGIERDVVGRLIKERDDARAELTSAIAAQRQCAALLAGVTAERASLAREIQDMKDDFQRFQRKIGRMYPETREFLDSALMPFTTDSPK